MDPSSLRPNKMWVIAAEQRENAFRRRNESLTRSYNHSTRPLPVIPTGTYVLIQDNDHRKRWNKCGTVVDRNDRKYFIRVQGSGRVITRNRKFIKEAPVDNQSEMFLPSSSSPNAGGGDDNDTLPVIQTVPETTTSPSVNNTPANTGSTSSGMNSSSQRSVPRMLQRLQPYNNRGLSE